ncbi:hypothetical protein BN1088_1431339 [Sphingobacterium sp. PM2-P1-29]|nr:hypothetical protein BN1088_1431339 [Sphingobacterium sp. PM2-P1-29]
MYSFSIITDADTRYKSEFVICYINGNSCGFSVKSIPDIFCYNMLSVFWQTCRFYTCVCNLGLILHIEGHLIKSTTIKEEIKTFKLTILVLLLVFKSLFLMVLNKSFLMDFAVSVSTKIYDQLL